MIGLRRFLHAADPADFLHRRDHHLQAARGMDVEHLDAEARRFDGRLGDGVGDVVKFEI